VRQATTGGIQHKVLEPKEEFVYVDGSSKNSLMVDSAERNSVETVKVVGTRSDESVEEEVLTDVPKSIRRDEWSRQDLHGLF
jgi:predicted patatin/cPLA2 family phospholipase